MDNVTIFCDASYCHITKCAGFGCWMRTTDEKYSFDAATKHVQSSVEAEIFAIVWAVDKAIAIFPENSRLIVVSDCESAIHTLRDKRLCGSDRLQESIRIFSELTKDRLVKLNHVKAHTKKKDPRSWVNKFCDSAAKRRMRVLRDQITKDTMISGKK